MNIELNNAVAVNNNIEPAAKKSYREVCSSLVFGKSCPAELNELKDKVAKFLKEKGNAAVSGDRSAAVEINSVITLLVEPPVLQALEILGFMGNYHELEYGQSAEVETWKLIGENGARVQAYNGDVGFGDWTYEKYPVKTISISGGTQVDYRALALGDFDSKLPEQIQYLTTDMQNKAVQYVIDNVFAALQNNTDYVKFYTQYSGTLTPAAVDAMVNKVRHFGRTSILADYSIISLISGWQGYISPAAGSYTPFYTEGMVDAIANNGKLDKYKGSDLVELPNPYNLLKPLADKTAFDTLYKEGRVLVMPTGIGTPVNIFRRGGITTFVGNDVKTGRILTRYDMEIGVDVVKGLEYMIGAIEPQA